MAGRASNRRFENLADLRVLFRGDALPVTEGAQHRLMRGVLTGASAAQRLAHAMHQRAVLIGDRRNNPRNQVVLKLKNVSGLKLRS